MSASAFAQRRCRNHPGRAAICRCPSCSFDYCRECTTEHEGRLLCSSCLARLVVTRKSPHRRLQSLRCAVLGTLGLLAAWAFFFGAAQAVTALAGPKEVHLWHAR
jgi:hypothetical protein